MRLLPRFNMKTLGMLLLVIALPLGWIASEINKVRRFEQTIQEFDARGIEVGKESDVLVLDSFPSPWKQRHVRTLNIFDEDLERIQDQTELVELLLLDSKVTDQGLRHLQHMKKLERLRLHNTEITNAGLQYLSALPALRRLYLDGTRVTDEGVASLNLSGFETLSLAGTAITDDVLESVSASESLDSIDVSDTQVTGAGLTRLAGMPSLHGHNVTHSRMKKNGNSPTLKALCQVLRRQEF